MENLQGIVLWILAENGETRALTLMKLSKKKLLEKKIMEPVVFEHNSTNLPLPILPLKTCNIKIDWGDGTTGLVNIDTPSHVYSRVGTYRVKIYNLLYDTKSRKVGEDILQLRGAHGWGDHIMHFISIGRIGITDLSFMFYGSAFNGAISPNWDTSLVTDFSFMFSGAALFNRPFGYNWDVRNVIKMSFMFSRARSYNQKIGQNWETNSLENIQAMFQKAESFNQPLGFSGEKCWDTSKVTDMSYLLSGAFNFNQKIGFSDTSKVRTLRGMFCGAIKFNQPFGLFGEKWDTSSVVDMSQMFRDAISFNQPFGLDWDISNVRDMSYMFDGAINFNQPLNFSTKNWSTIRNLKGMFHNAKSFDRKNMPKNMGGVYINDIFAEMSDEDYMNDWDNQ